MAEAMLAVYLREDFQSIGVDHHPGVRWRPSFDPPSAVRAVPHVERQGNCRAALLPNVLSEVETMRRVEAPLIASPRILIQDISEAQ